MIGAQKSRKITERILRYTVARAAKGRPYQRTCRYQSVVTAVSRKECRVRENGSASIGLAGVGEA